MDTDTELMTAGHFAKLAGISVETARLYADLRFVDSQRDSSGRRLYPYHAIQQAQTVLASRMRRATP